MRIIAFITFSADIRKILEHLGVDPEAPRITPARGPPLWDELVRRRRARVWRLSRIAIWQTNHRQTTPTINALLGEFAMGRDDCAGVGLCSEVARCVVCDALVQILGNSDCHLRENPVFSGRFTVQYLTSCG